MIKGLETLDPKVAAEITAAFDEAVNAKVAAETKKINKFNSNLKESYDKKLAQHKSRLQLESKIARARQEKAYKASLAKIEQTAIKAGIESEKSLNQLFESKMHRYAARLTAQIMKENKIAELQAEDSEKVLKLLSLFEEMLKTFGVTLKDLMEQSESEGKDDKEEVIEEAKRLKESYRKIFKEKVILESALRNNVTDVDGFKKVMLNVKFTNAKDYRSNCDIMAEKFSGATVANGFIKESKSRFTHRINAGKSDEVPSYLSYKDYL